MGEEGGGLHGRGRRLKERDLQKGVIDVAHAFGWYVAHFRTAINARGHYQTPVGADGKGFPDLCMVRERVVFMELKVRYRQLKPEQEIWRDRILASGTEWYLITEKEWDGGEVERILQPSAVRGTMVSDAT